MRRVFSAKHLRQVVLGVSAAPLVIASGCGRVMGSELELYELGVIPSKVVDGGPGDAGLPDAGAHDAGVPDAGMRKPIFSCKPYSTSTSGNSYYFDGGGLADPSYCVTLCPNDFDGTPIKVCQPVEENDLLCWMEFCGVGRLTEGVTPRARSAQALGGHLANMAAHEAAAALAFAQLADELSHHAVAPALVRRARRAAHEELRHTQLVGALARAHGAHFSVEGTTPGEPRSLEAIATENAAEGCVRETLGAMVGLHQSRHAADAQVRSVMAQVSADELGHAAWSHALASSLETRLSLSARRRVRRAREGALEAARAQLEASADPQLRGVLGLPDTELVQSWCLELRAVR